MSRTFIAGLMFLMLCFISALIGAFLYMDHHKIALDDDMFHFAEGPLYVTYFKASAWFFVLTMFALPLSFIIEYVDFQKDTKRAHNMHYNAYNYFSHKAEADYVLKHMMSDLLRAIWQWKYWNAPEEGSWGIAKIKEDTFDASIDVHYFGERFEAPYIPTFKTSEAVEECIAYLRKERLIK